MDKKGWAVLTCLSLGGLFTVLALMWMLAHAGVLDRTGAFGAAVAIVMVFALMVLAAASLVGFGGLLVSLLRANMKARNPDGLSDGSGRKGSGTEPVREEEPAQEETRPHTHTVRSQNTPVHGGRSGFGLALFTGLGTAILWIVAFSWVRSEVFPGLPYWEVLASAAIVFVIAFVSTLQDTSPSLFREPNRYVSKDTKAYVYLRDGGRCRHCGSTSDLEYDHIRAFSRGGSNTADNIQLLCRRCNRRKGVQGW